MHNLPSRSNPNPTSPLPPRKRRVIKIRIFSKANQIHLLPLLISVQASNLLQWLFKVSGKWNLHSKTVNKIDEMGLWAALKCLHMESKCANGALIPMYFLLQQAENVKGSLCTMNLTLMGCSCWIFFKNCASAAVHTAPSNTVMCLQYLFRIIHQFTVCEKQHYTTSIQNIKDTCSFHDIEWPDESRWELLYKQKYVDTPSN